MLIPLIRPALKQFRHLRVAGMASGTTAKFSNPADVASHDARYRAPEVVAQRKALVDLLDLKAGDRVLDIGCGTGYLLRDVATAVGSTGQAVGVEPSAEMRKMAEEKNKEFTQAELREGNGYSLPVDDKCFDAAIFSQVLLYIPDVRRAIVEASRTLKDDGQLAILDTDWGSLVANTAQPELLSRLQAAFETGFEDAHLPPKLPGIFAECGLRLEAVKTIPMIATGSLDPDSFMGSWALDKMPSKAKKKGVSEADIDAWLQEQKDLSGRGAAFACIHRFVFLVRKG